MDYQCQFYKFYRPYLSKISQAIENGDVQIFVGINAIGKTYLAEQIMSERFREEFIKEKSAHIVLLDFKDKSSPALKQVCQYWFSQTAKSIGIKINNIDEFNEFSFSTRMSEIVKSLKNEEKLVFLLLDAQNILHLPESFFTSLTYLKIYSYSRVSFVLLSEPHILDCRNPGAQRFIQRFINHRFLFLRAFERKTILADIQKQSQLLNMDFTKYQSIIVRYSKGLHGIIRTFCYLLKKNPQITNIRTLIKEAFKDKLCQFWVKEVLDSLPVQSVILLREIALHNRRFKDIQRNIYGRWLVSLGFLTKKGKLRYSYLLPFLKDPDQRDFNNNQIFRVSKRQLFIRGNQVSLPKEELITFQVLYKKKGKPVSYEEIGDAIWDGNEDKFSLWAIYQIIKRIRKRLSLYLVNPHIISSRRGEGYSLELI